MAFFCVVFWIFFVVGCLCTLAFLYDNLISLACMIKAFLQSHLQPGYPKTLIERYGKWAVVTGSTDGIGKEIARELARLGHNLVLISRTEAKLIAVTNEIEAQYKVQIKYIVADFVKGREVYEHIEKELEGIEVGILVNNVAMINEHPDTLDQLSEDMLWNMLTVNMGSITMLTRKILPQMIARRNGIIVNVGSTSDLQPQPNLTVYAATKMFVSYFSKGLEGEVSKHNIDVQLVKPGFVGTNMNAYSEKVMRGGLLFPNAATYAQSAVCTIGKTNETNGFWVHSVQTFFMKMIPIRLRTILVHRLFDRLRLEGIEYKKNKVQAASS